MKTLNIIYRMGFVALFIVSCSAPVSQNEEGEKVNNSILAPVSYLDVELTDNFWKPKIDENNESFLLPEGFKAGYHKNLLGGFVTLKGYASLLRVEDEIDITAIPYYTWSNRGQGQMKVWLPFLKK